MENELLTIFGVNLGWPEAFAIASAVFAIVLGISTYLIKTFKINRDQAHGVRISSMEKDIHIIESRIGELKKAVETHDARDQADFTKLERKIDDLNNLFIEFLRTQVNK